MHWSEMSAHMSFSTCGDKVLLKESGLEDDLPNGVTITVDDYAWAVSVVTRSVLPLNQRNAAALLRRLPRRRSSCAQAFASLGLGLSDSRAALAPVPPAGEAAEPG